MKRTHRLMKILLLTELALVVLILAIVALAGWNMAGPRFVRELPIRSLFTRLAMATLTLLPVVALVLLMFMLAFGQKRPRRAVRMMFATGLGSLIVGAVAIWLVETDRRAFVLRYGSSPFPSPFNIGNMTSWGVVVFLWIAFMYVLAALWKKNWQRLKSQHLPKTIEFRKEGICISDAHSRLEYSWQAIAKVVDTPSLLLFYLDELAFYIVPKRAFDGGELDAFWKFAGEKGESARQGFTVVAPLYVAEESRP